MISVQQWAKWMTKGSSSVPSVLLENYKELQLSDGEMMLIIHLHSFASEGILFPSPEQLQERMTCSDNEISEMLNRLHKMQFIDIISSVDQEGRREESYSLELLWEKVIMLLSSSDEQGVASLEVAASQDGYPSWPSDLDQNVDDIRQVEGQIFQRFEQEFGRVLSPIECETISLWLDDDGYQPHLIFLALREAVISSKLSLRYIDRILFEWQKNGIKTVEEVREHSKKFRQQQPSKHKSKDQPEPEFSFYNWLEK